MTFEEVIGQDEAKQSLVKLIEEHRVPHAMLFCGPMGCGKKALALAFASRLLGDSQLLRQWHQEGKSLRYYIPDAVANYINEHHIYHITEGAPETNG